MPSIASLALAVTALVPAPQQRPPILPPIPADKEPVKTSETGLRWCVLEPGKEGPSPKFADVVKVNYTGWNTDGSVVDSSRSSGKPAEFTIGGGIIDGWNEALMSMTPGARWKLTIPPDLAYGKLGSPPVIKPNATLIFDLELVSFEKGVDVPPFHAGDTAKQRKTESGIVYEPIVDSVNQPPRPEDVIEARIAMWTTKGRMVACTEMNPKFAIKGRSIDVPIRFLQIAPQYVPVGARYRFEVPFELCKNAPGFGAPYLPAGATTIWEVEVVSAKEAKIPPFEKPDATKQTTTASGLKYEVLREGNGKKPEPKTQVSVHYTGWLADGTFVDSSHSRGSEMTYVFPGAPGTLIAGWVEGAALMSEGALFRFEIPSALAYGPKGRLPKVPPDSPMVFLIEMVKVGSDG